MIDPHQKLIPALVHKNIANDFAINAYNFERNVQVYVILLLNLEEIVIFMFQEHFSSDSTTFASRDYRP